ncbi:MAG: hypothetical protein M3Y41_08925, partial [Pseudomonadota bacterium]|nr:hypothetical protein [Pseudomonadota bacterium]
MAVNESADDLQAVAPFTHYLRAVWAQRPDVSVSVYFDAGWYRSAYPEVETAIHAGRWLCGLHHYLCGEAPLSPDPL